MADSFCEETAKAVTSRQLTYPVDHLITRVPQPERARAGARFEETINAGLILVVKADDALRASVNPRGNPFSLHEYKALPHTVEEKG